MYVIRLKNCAFFAHHGVLDEEEALGQRFYVDAELTVDGIYSLEADNIEETVHYGSVFRSIERIVTGERRLLIETLALSIAKTLCAEFAQLRRAAITVRKPSAPIRGMLDHVEVTVAWPQ